MKQIIFIIVLLLITMVNAQETYTINSYQSKNKDNSWTKKIYSEPIFFNQIVKLTNEGEDLILEWKEHKVRIKLNVKEKGKDKESISNFKSKTDSLEIVNKYQDFSYEYGWILKGKDFNIDYFTMELENLTNLDIRLENNIFYLDDLIILNDDLLDNNFTLTKLNDKEFKITAEKKDNFKSNEINLDPKIVSIYTSKDSYIRIGSADSNYGTDNTATFDEGSQYKALIDFDLSSIAKNSSVSLASVYLYLSTNSAGDVKTIYPINYAWTENGVTWNSRDGITNWDTAGLGTTDYNTTFSYSNASPSSWLNIESTEIINLTINQKWDFNGFLVLNQDGTDHIFRTKEYTGTSSDPYMIVTYNFPEIDMEMSPSNNSYHTNSLINFWCNVSIPKNSDANITYITLWYANQTTGGVDTNWSGVYAFDLNDTSIVKSANSVNVNWSVNLSYEGDFYYGCKASATFKEDGTEYEMGGITDYKLTFNTSDISAPVFTNLRNFNHYINTNFQQTINATDQTGVNQYWLNDTSSFNINSTNGEITNITELDTIKSFNLKIYVNDTLGHETYGEFKISIIERPIKTFTYCLYQEFGYYNLNLPWIREEECLIKNTFGY